MKREKMVFEFDLVFSLPKGSANEDALLDALFEAGCDDAVVGLGAPGLTAVSLERAGDNAEAVISEAATQVLNALPEGAELREVRPDLVSQADVAARLGVTRQALQKRELPAPAVGGLYRMSELYPRLVESRRGKLAAKVDAARAWFEASHGAQRINARISLGEIRFRKTA